MHLLLILCVFEKNILLISQNIYLHRIHSVRMLLKSQVRQSFGGGWGGGGEGDQRDTSSHVLARE